MKADMHMHSRYSDGGHWPRELARMAAASGLETVCLTDHDTLGGYPEFAKAAAELGLTTWASVEIDCVDEGLGYKSEILAYFPEGHFAATDALLRASRLERARAMQALFDRARELFGSPDIKFPSLVARRTDGRAVDDSVIDEADLRYSKTDLFLALVAANAIPAETAYRDFKRAYFDTGLFSDVRFGKPALADIVATIRSDGGIPVLPHVGHEFDDSIKTIRTRAKDFQKLLDRCSETGVMGIELYDYRNADTKAINALVAREASRRGFFVTYGSDFHGPGTNRTQFGSFQGDFKGFPRPKARRKG